MSGLGHSSVAQDFSIEVAENEGMPTGPNFDNASPLLEPTQTFTRKRHLGLSKEHAITCDPRPLKKILLKNLKKSMTRSRLSRIALLAVLTGVVSSMAFPIFAQDGTGPLPNNAEARKYGGGWNCTLGYRVSHAKCIAIEVPENAYATGRSYGTGWACRRGYEDAGGISCKAIPIPKNAFLTPSGFDWQCHRGYRQEREICIPIVLPDNAHLNNDTSGSGWTCNRGFSNTSAYCAPIVIPENAYPTNADYGDEWACERGFFEINGRCDTVAIPSNAFLDPGPLGPGWRCKRGFKPVEKTCVAIELPANAHLDRLGNRWSCDRGFQSLDGECVIGR
jgi:hypothetical protein